MSASWINEAAVVDWLVKSTVLIALAWAAASGAYKLKSPAALRHLLWLLAIAAALALPAIAALTPMRLAVMPAFYDPATVRSAFASPPVAWTLVDLMPALYAGVAALLLLRVAMGQWRLNTLWRRALRVDSIQYQSDALAEAIGLRRRTAVRVADHASAPMTWGIAQPKILLPAAAIGWAPAQRRLVLMHELAHVARADSFTQLLAAVALAFSWFQPALWFAAAHLRREQEHACDDRVLLAGASPDAYARTLLDVAAGRFAAVAPTGVMMAAPSQLEARLKAITAGRPRVIGFAGAAAVMFGVCVALVAAVIAAPAPPTRREPAIHLVAAVAPVARSAVASTLRARVAASVANGPSSFARPVTMIAAGAQVAIAPTAPIEPTVPASVAVPAVTATPAVAALPSVPAVAPVTSTPATPATPSAERRRPPAPSARSP